MEVCREALLEEFYKIMTPEPREIVPCDGVSMDSRFGSQVLWFVSFD